MKNNLILTVVLLSFILLSGYSHALCVNVPEANLRSGPGTNFEKTWEVFKYMPLNKLTEKGNWYKVKDVDGDVHWIYKKLVTKKFRCAVVKTDKINVRTGPGTGYSKNALSPALKYDSFKVLQIKSSWAKVIDEFGDTGWIFRKLLWIQ
jgi:SH3-like domain-containing protein